MSARSKLNVAFANGSVLVAAIFGLLANSWTVFFVVLAVTLAGAWYCGDIRAGGGTRRQLPR